ncbi:MAG: DUF1674 domain-containing protein [Alphaproteobacteria bacterium]|jgi:hypothetical protein
MQKPKESSPPPEKPASVTPAPTPAPRPEGEIGGSGKPEPTRYGDWEIGGKCVDF